MESISSGRLETRDKKEKKALRKEPGKASTSDRPQTPRGPPRQKPKSRKHGSKIDKEELVNLILEQSSKI